MTEPGAKPALAAVELLIAGLVIWAGLTFNSVLFVLGSAVWLVAIGAVILYVRRPAVRGFGLGRPPSIPRTLIIGALVGIGYQIFGTYVIEPGITRLTTGVLPDVSGFRHLVGNNRALVQFTLQAIVVAGFCEEVAYRGWIMTRMAELGRYSRAAWVGATLASSIAFGVIHMYQGVSGMISTGLSGLLFAGLYFATGRNLWAPIVAHALMDIAGFVMVYKGVYPGL
jgi:hypothetical protein